jgi:hypothetical protein
MPVSINRGNAIAVIKETLRLFDIHLKILHNESARRHPGFMWKPEMALAGDYPSFHGALVDLNNDGELWARVSPTSGNDNAGRSTNNSNWQQGSDGDMYVRVQAVTGTVIVE